MRVLFFLLLASALSLNVLAQKATSPTEACAPYTVSFEAPATSTTYYWDMGDGSISELEKPTNQYTNPGRYTVTFRETKNGPVLGSIDVKIYERPKPSYTSETPIGCVYGDLKIKNTTVKDPAIKILEYTWLFGDGYKATGDSVVHAYSDAGEYKISLGFTTNLPNCENSDIFDAIKIYNRPQAGFTTDPGSTFTCENNLKVAFTNVSVGEPPLVYSWDFGNGAKSVEKDPLPQNYIKGQYISKLNVAFKDAPACSSQVGKAIAVGKPVAKIEAVRDTVCIISQTLFKSSSVGKKKWEITPGGYLFFDFGDSIGIHFQDSGWFKVKLTVTSADDRCYDTSVVNVYAQKISAEIQSTPQFGCSSPMEINYKAVTKDKNLLYSWNFANDPKTYTSQSVTKVFKSDTDSVYYGVNSLELIPVSLQVYSKTTGCRNEVNKADTLFVPNARFMPDKTKGCGPMTVTFSDSSSTYGGNPIVSWKWLFGDKDNNFLIRNDSNNVSFTYKTPGEYLARLVVTTKKGCVDTSFAVKIEVGEDLSSQLTFTALPQSVCPGDPVTFKVTSNHPFIDAYHFQTEDNRSFHCSSSKEASWSYKNVVGSQDVYLTADYNGCIFTATNPVKVMVKGAIPKIDYVALCKDPLKYTFTSKTLGSGTLAWDFGDGKSGISDVEVHNFDTPGNFQVQLKVTPSDKSCKAQTEVVTVTPRIPKAVISLEKPGDSLFCMSSTHTLDASLSSDVYPDCHKGYTWQFPTTQYMRPRTSSSPATAFVFSEPGEHTVRLIVQDINGCKDTTTTRIKIYDMTVNAKANKSSICLPSDVSIADLSVADTTIVNWRWTFVGDTLIDYSTFRDSVRHTYKTGKNPNDLYYFLTVTDKIGCKETFNGQFAYYEPSTVVHLDDKVCVGETVEISADDFTAAGSSLDFLWNVGVGPDLTGKTNKVVYDKSGSYPVTLKFVEKSSACAGERTATISVQSKPKARFSSLTLDTVAVICAIVRPELKDSSSEGDAYSPIVSRYWKNSDLATWDNTRNPPTPSWAFDKGKHFISLKVETANGCFSDTTGVFQVESPMGNFTMDKPSICLDDEITFVLKDTNDVRYWQWNFEGETRDSINPVSHKFTVHPNNNITKAKLMLTGWKGGCKRAFEQDIYIYPVIAAFERESEPLDTNICFNDGPFHLKNTSLNGDKFKWNFGDGTPEDSITNEPAHKYATPGQYPVLLTIKNNTHGCVDTLEKIAVVYPNPKVNASSDTMCFGSTTKVIHLNVKSPVTTSRYHWSPSDGVANVNADSTTAVPEQTTLYKVVETDTATGCTDFTEVTGLVVKRIDTRDWDTTIVIGDFATLPLYGDPVYKFKWTPEAGLSCTDCFYPKAQPLEDIIYNLVVSDIYSCWNDPYRFEITVKPETFVKLPSAFTPNGDTKNDKVYVKGWGIKKLVEYKVFNRWGQEIFSTDDINEGWDGTFKGQKQNSDLYVYKVKVITWKEEEKYVEGYINLLY
ncbi:MAG: PKD domain-containing protein [Sporocytophaga sp.]|uniref:PKD domain-containing protein n=1 Tax=Sporocytophaga sp. TaxID=2231183 RepID=UPI001B029894|nr:PKD domain-containing protein [Sporocytophaga sp.]MBO9698891.1 PKD domain-containing protein [Sporocytophaga sp.]